jgi:hypothetical protein
MLPDGWKWKVEETSEKANARFLCPPIPYDPTITEQEAAQWWKSHTPEEGKKAFRVEWFIAGRHIALVSLGES